MKTITLTDEQLNVLRFVLEELSSEYVEAADAEIDISLNEFYRERASQIASVYEYIFEKE